MAQVGLDAVAGSTQKLEDDDAAKEEAEAGAWDVQNLGFDGSF